MTESAERYPVVFDETYFARRGEVMPRAAFEVAGDRDANERLVGERLQALVPGILVEAHGPFGHGYVVPGSVYTALWDWDAYFVGLALEDRLLNYARGSILNFLERVRYDGRPAKLVHEDGTIDYGSHPLPLQAQWCVAATRDGDFDWVRPHWPALRRAAEWYDRQTRGRRGLFVWSSWAGNGIDNNPAVYGRPPRSAIGIDLNCFHYREFLALARLAAALGERSSADAFRGKAAELHAAINRYLWDPVDGFYYNADNLTAEAPSLQEITWEIPIKIKSWAGLFALWSGVATPERAERVVREHVMNEAEFLSPYGIRSMAATEPWYTNAPMGNPSNWNGPVWGLSTFLTAYGLARYGYRDEALEAAGRLIDVYASDLRTNGLIHEYYDADTGRPVIKPGFLSWNLLAVRVLGDIRNGVDPAAIAD